MSDTTLYIILSVLGIGLILFIIGAVKATSISLKRKKKLQSGSSNFNYKDFQPLTSSHFHDSSEFPAFDEGGCAFDFNQLQEVNEQ